MVVAHRSLNTQPTERGTQTDEQAHRDHRDSHRLAEHGIPVADLERLECDTAGDER